MNNIIIERSTINAEALDSDLRAALGAAITGVSIANGKLVIHLNDSATPQQEIQARQIVQNHNPAQLAPAQQAEAQRRQRLDQARQESALQALDVQDYSKMDPAIRRLAQKIAWLEQEIADLRVGG